MKIFNPQILLSILSAIFALLFYFFKNNVQTIGGYWIAALVGLIISYVIYDTIIFIKSKFKK
jgi:Flp pilus assembly protein protease CpaA